MKLLFDPPNDGKVHTYCLGCIQETVRQITSNRQQLFRCDTCGHTNGRALIIDPSIRWWLDSSKEYWHEAAGIFVHNSEGKFLFFERTKFPFGLTVPAGHVDKGERPQRAAKRELREETGIVTGDIVHTRTSDMYGDQCQRGADVHRWHCFVAKTPTTRVRLGNEGRKAVWLTLDQALTHDLTFVVRYVIDRYGHELRRAVQ